MGVREACVDREVRRSIGRPVGTEGMQVPRYKYGTF